MFFVVMVSWFHVMPSGASPVHFNRDIRPILSDNCFSCHGPDKSHRKAGLRLDTPDGKDKLSEVLERITTSDPDLRMPPPETGKELSAEQVAILKDWIKQGATYEPHWSYMPPSRPNIPDVTDAAWARGPIDRFILAPIEAEGRSPAPEADRATLLRRLAFDLTGLPPSVDDVDAFLVDAMPDAFESRVDRLLASPRYGERLAIYWLDLIRYADSVGYHGDQEHEISPFRAYVIDAFNAGLPFDQFTREQLAGDLLPNPTLEQRFASGYNRVLQTSHEGGVQVKEYLAKYAADRVRNVSATWMGATLGCAECHDHKFDPYTQEDFYAMAAFFADIDEMKTFRGGNNSPTSREPEIVDPRSGLKSMITQTVPPRTMRVLDRGDWMDENGPIVTPQVPHFLPRIEGLETDTRPTRLDLADWITSSENPQTARVFMNRAWYLFFGRGFTDSLEDTGSQGDWPSHPELLDWLAVEFTSDWDVKRMVREVMTSATYRQESKPGGDPLFAAQGRWRLPAEMIRDNALSLSGLLVEQLGGASARPYQPEGYYAHLNFPKRSYKEDRDAGQYRRGVYVHWQRQFLHPMMLAFDAPSREECTAKRPRSNTPLQALGLLNDPSFVEASRMFADQAMKIDQSETERLDWMWKLATSRTPSVREREVLERLLTRSRGHYQDHPSDADALLGVGMATVSDDVKRVELAAWTTIARALLNVHETIARR